MYITNLLEVSMCIKEVESVIYAFVWRDKKERLKRRVLIKNKEEGGLKVPSFKFIVDSVEFPYFIYPRKD